MSSDISISDAWLKSSRKSDKSIDDSVKPNSMLDDIKSQIRVDITKTDQSVLIESDNNDQLVPPIKNTIEDDTNIVPEKIDDDERNILPIDIITTSNRDNTNVKSKSKGDEPKAPTKDTTIRTNTEVDEFKTHIKDIKVNGDEPKIPTKDSISRTNTKVDEPKIPTKDSISRTNTKVDEPKIPTKDSISRTNTKVDEPKIPTKDSISRTNTKVDEPKIPPNTISRTNTSTKVDEPKIPTKDSISRTNTKVDEPKTPIKTNSSTNNNTSIRKDEPKIPPNTKVDEPKTPPKNIINGIKAQSDDINVRLENIKRQLAGVDLYSNNTNNNTNNKTNNNVNNKTSVNNNTNNKTSVNNNTNRATTTTLVQNNINRGIITTNTNNNIIRAALVQNNRNNNINNIRNVRQQVRFENSSTAEAWIGGCRSHGCDHDTSDSTHCTDEDTNTNDCTGDDRYKTISCTVVECDKCNHKCDDKKEKKCNNKKCDWKRKREEKCHDSSSDSDCEEFDIYIVNCGDEHITYLNTNDKSRAYRNLVISLTS